MQTNPIAKLAVAALVILLVMTSAAQVPTVVFIFSGQSNESAYGNFGVVDPVPSWAQTFAADYPTTAGWVGHPARSLDTLQPYETSWRSIPGLLWNAWNDQRQQGYCPPSGNPAGPYDAWGTGTIGKGPGYAGCTFSTNIESNFGPEFAFVVKYHNDHPGVPIAVIKQAFGGQGIRQWIPYDASTNPFGGSQWPDFQAIVNQAKARLAAAGVSYTWGGMIWSQGETDIGNPNYITLTRQFFASVRAMTSSTLPITMGRMSDVMFATAVSGGVGTTIYNKTTQTRADQVTLGGDAHNTWWNRDGEPPCCGTDPTIWYHTTTDGYLADGERAYAAWKAAFEPTSGVAPTVTTAALTGATLAVAYSQTLLATGDAPITWSIVAGTLPGWASLNTSTGAITGTPNAAGSTSFTVRASNAVGTGDKALSLSVPAPGTTWRGIVMRLGVR